MRPILILFCYCFALVGQSQTCDYLTKKFPVRSQLDIFYGEAINYDSSKATLRLNIYSPVGDNRTNRPIVFFVHGGGFSGGNKNETEDICKSFAARGYIAVSPSYRLGFYRPGQFDYPYCLDHAELYRALHRAIQDVKGAIRFIKNRSSLDSSNPHAVYIGGFSAGGFIALSVGHIDKLSEKIPLTDSIQDANTFYGNKPRHALGSHIGNLHLGNYDASVSGVINLFGALTDTSYIEPQGVPTFLYHQINDPVVPCGINKPYYFFPFGVPDNYPLVYGSCYLKGIFEKNGYSSGSFRTWIINGNNHSVHQAYSVDTAIASQLNFWICKSLKQQILEPKAPQVFWNENGLKIESTFPVQMQIFDLTGKCLFKNPASHSEFISKEYLKIESPSFVILHLVDEHGFSWKKKVFLP